MSLILSSLIKCKAAQQRGIVRQILKKLPLYFNYLSFLWLILVFSVIWLGRCVLKHWIFSGCFSGPVCFVDLQPHYMRYFMLQEYKRLMLLPLLNKSLLVVLLNSSVNVRLFSYTIKASFFCTNKSRATGFFCLDYRDNP